MIGKWDGFTVGPWGIAGRVVGLLRHGVPQAQVFEYAADDSSVVDDGDDAHGIFTFWAFQRVDFIDFLDKPGPVGFGFVVQRRLVQVQGGAGGGTWICISLSPCPVTVPAIVTYEVLVFVRDVGE